VLTQSFLNEPVLLAWLLSGKSRSPRLVTVPLSANRLTVALLGRGAAQIETLRLTDLPGNGEARETTDRNCT
jgi:hypothetical protein